MILTVKNVSVYIGYHSKRTQKLYQ